MEITVQVNNFAGITVQFIDQNSNICMEITVQVNNFAGITVQFIDQNSNARSGIMVQVIDQNSNIRSTKNGIKNKKFIFRAKNESGK